MSDSSSDEDVVVLQVCSNRNCGGIDDLEMDEETNLLYCGRCRALYARTETEGFRILLSDDDFAVIKMIFDCFDCDKREYWTFTEWNEYRRHIDRPCGDEITSPDELQLFFMEEYDIGIEKDDKENYVIRLADLENMYGGYQFNDIPALIEDCDAFEDQELLRTGRLE